jgi:plastocyanin
LKILRFRSFGAFGICLLGILCSSLLPAFSWAQPQTFTVSGVVQVTHAPSPRKASGNANIVVWLVPVNETGSHVAASPSPARKRFTLLQKNKSFEPHVLVIPVGSQVEFPNKDPFFHNVFSLFEGKRFDLGLYESGSTRSLSFERPGISYLFCNIHSEMSAVIIALETPYYATSNQTGEITIPDVPAGRYWMHVWKEGVPQGTLKTLSRPVLISTDSTSLGKLIVPDNASVPLAHKNKYGRDYEDPTPPGQVYDGH